MSAEKACDGGRVLEAWHEMAECAHCGRQVRWGLREHRLFGFGSCPERWPGPELLEQLQPEERTDLTLGRVDQAHASPAAVELGLNDGRGTERRAVAAHLEVAGAGTAGQAHGLDVEVTHPGDGSTGRKATP